MGLCNDRWINEHAINGMIKPYMPIQVKSYWNDGVHSIMKDNYTMPVVPCISYGVSSYGYDMRVAGEFKIFSNLWPGIVDPKKFDKYLKFHDIIVSEDSPDNDIIIPPNSFALARSVEYFKIPRNVLAICIGKSTYARCGLVANITAFEPEWEGHVTIELSNTTPLPVKVYAFEGIAQVLFFEADEVCEVSYADKKGKYQGQLGITMPKV